jgi:hypothetical protein
LETEKKVMSCSVFSDKINIVMDSQVDTPVPGLAAGSALQNPDLSRAKLGAILRQRPRSSPKKAHNLFWSAFTAYHADQCANCNE